MAIANEISEMSDIYPVQLAMLKKDNLSRAVSQKQQKEVCLQISAPNDQLFHLLGEFAPFLLQSSGKDDNGRILILGDTTMKSFLNFSNTWLVDGTFRMSPKIFINFTQSI